MKNKRLISKVLVASMICSTFGISTPVSAEVKSTPTQFSAEASVLGGDLVVTIPDDLVLAYDEENSRFYKADVVNATGNINPKKMLKVSTDTNITYTHKDVSSIKANGTVTFGTTDGDKQVSIWKAVDLAADLNNGVDKDISSTVSMSEIQYIGGYSSVIDFNIEIVDDPDVVTTSTYAAFRYTNAPVTYTDNFNLAYEIYEDNGTVAELVAWGTDRAALEAQGYDYIEEFTTSDIAIPAQVEGNDVVNVEFDDFFANDDICTNVTSVNVPKGVEGVELSDDAYLESDSTTVITCNNIRLGVNVAKKIPRDAKIRFRFMNDNGEIDFRDFFQYSYVNCSDYNDGNSNVDGSSDEYIPICFSEFGINYLKTHYNESDTVEITYPCTSPKGYACEVLSLNEDYINKDGADVTNLDYTSLPKITITTCDSYKAFRANSSSFVDSTDRNWRKYLLENLTELDLHGIEYVTKANNARTDFKNIKKLTIPAGFTFKNKVNNEYSYIGTLNVETIEFEDGFDFATLAAERDGDYYAWASILEDRGDASNEIPHLTDVYLPASCKNFNPTWINRTDDTKDGTNIVDYWVHFDSNIEDVTFCGDRHWYVYYMVYEFRDGLVDANGKKFADAKDNSGVTSYFDRDTRTLYIKSNDYVWQYSSGTVPNFNNVVVKNTVTNINNMFTATGTNFTTSNLSNGGGTPLTVTLEKGTVLDTSSFTKFGKDYGVNGTKFKGVITMPADENFDSYNVCGYVDVLDMRAIGDIFENLLRRLTADTLLLKSTTNFTYGDDNVEFKNLYLDYTGLASTYNRFNNKFHITDNVYFTGTEDEWNAYMSHMSYTNEGNTYYFLNIDAGATVHFNCTIPDDLYTLVSQ